MNKQTGNGFESNTSIGSSGSCNSMADKYASCKLYTCITGHLQIVSHLLKIWTSETFHERHRRLIANLKNASKEVRSELPWREPKLIIKCLLAHFK